MADDKKRSLTLVPLGTSIALTDPSHSLDFKYEPSVDFKRYLNDILSGGIAPNLFAFARGMVADLAKAASTDAEQERIRSQSTWNGASNTDRLASADEPGIGIYIATEGPVAARDLGVLFQRFETLIRRQLRGYGRYEVRVDVEYLAQGSVYAQFGVHRRRRASRGKPKKPWSRADKLALTAIIVSIMIGLAEMSPFKRANDCVIQNNNVTSIVYTNGKESVAATPHGVFVTPNLAPKKIGSKTVAPKTAEDFVHEVTITYVNGKPMADVDGTGPQFPIADRRTPGSKPFEDHAVYTLWGKLRYRDGKPTQIVVTEAFKLAG